MDGFELNKIAGAVLGSLLAILGINKLMNVVYAAPHALAKPAYVVEGVATEAAHEGTAEAAPQLSLPELLAATTPEAGKRVSGQCIACHSFDKGGPNKVGPNLWGVVGGPIAHKDDFTYSASFQKAHAAGEKWTDEALFNYLENPAKIMPGTKMAFAGLKKPDQRAALITFLRQQSDNAPPAPAPK